MDSKRTFDIAECHQAAKGLKSSWQDMAGSEALIRALVAERNGDTLLALFWTEVHRTLCEEK
ncbi:MULTISPECIES: hypothetical protein [unclassified Rhizobium]|jgi:hypothetical protein|uniref:hypothetical protein n=1 Tax=unclassified Rhizobium TaxID=2613769 RepID=UPI000DDEE815|nr:MULTISPECIES: hypothetical protein [unclassified Rhizobium]MBB3390069.1 hypothetical protein [Rhizobium sp. BK275]MBB3409468.1 hypothetical protein [Rhizobium sp. BK316]MBB3590170.1 hypothetical protein [Rhizobium sp. BK529]QWW66549.1 hypothetical protein KQ933_13050 [Rhizobium sp. WYJ-E13]TCS04865.1 hypothetical protein EV281_103544 [Rhizobium sp. BK418]